MRLWSINPALRELRPTGSLRSREASPGRVFRRADQTIKTLTLASEIHQAALVLGPSPEDPSEFGPTSKGPKRWSSRRLIQWKNESQKSLVPTI
jgi:hypothetical protein